LRFDRDIAEVYESWYQTPKGWFVDTLEKELIRDLCQVKPGEKVLEIGCGTGHFSAFFKELGAQVTGLDTSPEMLKVAKDLHSDLKVKFDVGRAYKLPFADKTFDLVAMITVLEFIDDPKQALKEAFRVSKGRVFIGFLNANSLLARKRKKSKKEIWREAHFYSLGEILGLLGQKGKIVKRSVIYLPLINSSLLFNARLNLERLFCKLNLPFGAFSGILAIS